MIDLPNQKERAPVWGRLGMPLSEKDTTDTETGETTTLLGSNTIQSPEGGQGDEEEPPRWSHRSDKQSTVLSDEGRRSRGYSSGHLASRQAPRAVNIFRKGKEKNVPCQKHQTIWMLSQGHHVSRRDRST